MLGFWWRFICAVVGGDSAASGRQSPNTERAQAFSVPKGAAATGTAASRAPGVRQRRSPRGSCHPGHPCGAAETPAAETKASLGPAASYGRLVMVASSLAADRHCQSATGIALSRNNAILLPACRRKRGSHSAALQRLACSQPVPRGAAVSACRGHLACAPFCRASTGQPWPGLCISPNGRQPVTAFGCSSSLAGCTHARCRISSVGVRARAISAVATCSFTHQSAARLAAAEGDGWHADGMRMAGGRRRRRQTGRRLLAERAPVTNCGNLRGGNGEPGADLA